MDKLDGFCKRLLASDYVIADFDNYIYQDQGRCRCFKGKSENVI